MTMGLPQISVTFKNKAASVIARGSRGVVALVLKDDSVTAGTSIFEMNDVTEIPEGLSATNTDIVEKAFMGGAKTPKKVAAIVIPTGSANYAAALSLLETVKFDYLAIPGIAGGETAAIASWMKTMRDDRDIRIKAILPDTAGDHEGIINFCTSDIKVGVQTYSASQYTARIAGLLAGTPLTTSATYWPLPEVTDIPRLSRTQYDEAIAAGKLVLYHDGEKVKVARAINSLVTTSADKGEDFRKIKLVDIMDLRHDDVKRTIEDTYIGKFPNSYDSKLLLVSSIKGYDEGLETEGLLDPTFTNVTGIDILAQKNYLISKGISVENMSEQQIKQANTGDRIFLSSNIRLLDAIEDFTLTTVI